MSSLGLARRSSFELWTLVSFRVSLALASESKYMPHLQKATLISIILSPTIYKSIINMIKSSYYPKVNNHSKIDDKYLIRVSLQDTSKLFELLVLHKNLDLEFQNRPDILLNISKNKLGQPFQTLPNSPLISQIIQNLSNSNFLGPIIQTITT